MHASHLPWLALIALVSGPALARGQTYVAVGVAVPDFAYEIERQTTAADDSEATLTYEPWIPLAATVAVGYEGLSVGTSFDLEGEAPDAAATEAEAKTESSYASYELSYFYERFGLDLSYVALTGMNVTEATGYGDSVVSSDRDAHRPDIQLQSQSVNVWVEPFGKNLSLKDFFDTASPAHGSGIALLMLASYDRLDERTKRELIPEKFNRGYGTDAGFMGGNFQSVAASAGPAFVLEGHGLYLAGLGAVGTGRQWATYRTVDDGEQTTQRASDKMRAQVDAGYKGKSLFSVVGYRFDSPTYHLNSITISTTRSLLSWVIGLRF